MCVVYVECGVCVCVCVCCVCMCVWVCVCMCVVYVKWCVCVYVCGVGVNIKVQEMCSGQILTVSLLLFNYLETPQDVQSKRIRYK